MAPITKSGVWWASTVSWVVICAVTIAVSFDTDLRWRYLLDMHVYIQGAEHFWTGTELYDSYFPTRNEGLPFTYPPFGAVVFSPLWLLTELIGQTATERVFTVLSVVMLWLVARTLVTAVGGAGRRVPVPVVMAVLIVSLTVMSTLDLGQINTVLMALVITDVGRLFPRIPLGLLTGIAAAIKLTPLVFGLYFLVILVARRKPGGLIGMGVGFLGATAFAWILRPAASVEYWTETLLSSSRIGEPWYAKNVSIKGALSRFPDLTGATVVWGIAVVLVILLVTVAVLRVLHDSGRRHPGVSTPAEAVPGEPLLPHLLAITLVSLISLLCSPVSWHHHWVWLGPLAVCLWFSGHGILAGWAVFAQTLGAFHMFLRSAGGIEFDWTLPEHILGTHYLWFSVIVLICVAVKPIRVRPARAEIPAGRGIEGSVSPGAETPG